MLEVDGVKVQSGLDRSTLDAWCGTDTKQSEIQLNVLLRIFEFRSAFLHKFLKFFHTSSVVARQLYAQIVIEYPIRLWSI